MLDDINDEPPLAPKHLVVHDARRSAFALRTRGSTATHRTARLSRRTSASFLTAIAPSSGNTKRDATASLAKAQRRGRAHRRSEAAAEG
jgi:hypothetical protein